MSSLRVNKINGINVVVKSLLCDSYRSVISISALFHNGTFDYRKKFESFSDKKKHLAVTNRLLELWNTENGLNFLTKKKRWRNFTYDSWFSTEKIPYIFLSM